MQGGAVRKAEEWFEGMLRAGIEANAISYSCVINACALDCQADRAEHWLNKHVVGNLSWHVCMYMCLYGRVRWPSLGSSSVVVQIYPGTKVLFVPTDLSRAESSHVYFSIF